MYALTIFVSAFLLFCVQPLMGRLVLPWFGGSAAVWTACLLFFQVVLLLGYFYAYALVRWLSPPLQARVHLGLLVTSLLFLPLWPAERWKPLGTEDPTLRIVLLLFATVGLPYVLLASTSPLLQAWYVRGNRDGRPYRLFALSNLGSMLALLGYVLVIEPRWSLGIQSLGWSAGYGLFVACAGHCALRSLQGSVDIAHDAPDIQAVKPSLLVKLLWLLLSGCASLMLMSITHHVSTNVAPVPFLWVGMLTVYLVSFILCFEGHNLYWRWLYYPLLALALWTMAYYLQVGKENTTAWTLIPIFLGCLFVVCMVTHGELARLRPPTRWLTTFYLMVSLGGALGGLFTGAIAPRIFPDYFETHIGVVLCPVLLIIVWIHEIGPPRRFLKIAGVGLWMAGTVYLAYFMAKQAKNQVEGYVTLGRNFYGTLKVTGVDHGTEKERLSLTNGTITHGEQFSSAQRCRDATTYYGPNSGVGLAIISTRTKMPQRVGIVGLGTGTLASYGRAGDVYRFYEINPLAIDIARGTFTYLQNARQTIDILQGDARLTMEREEAQRYDVLAIDAFTSDAIPLHLLTLEAFSQYFRHLAPDGILAVHVSNHYLHLDPVVRAAADSFHKRSMLVDSDDDEKAGLLGSLWVLVGNGPQSFRSPNFKVGVQVTEQNGLRVWTDDYANVLEILK